MTGIVSSKALRDSQEDATGARAQHERSTIWTSLPGKIKDFDPATQTATITLQHKVKHNGEWQDMPDLPGVPVIFTRGGGAVFTHPIKEGDGVMVQFQSRDMSAWYDGDKADQPPSARMHDLSDAVAIPGMVAEPKKLANFNNSHAQIRSEDGKNALTFDQESGKFSMTGAGGTEDLFTIVKELLAALKDDKLVINYGSSAGTGHALEKAALYAALESRLDKIKL